MIQNIYRHALNLVRLGWQFTRSLGYLSGIFPKENPKDVYTGTVAAYAGRAVAQWMDANRDDVIENAWRTAPATKFEYGKLYSQDQLRSIFPQVVREPYSLYILNHVDGYNLSGFQSYKVDVYEDERIKIAYNEIAKQLRIDYKLTGDVAIVFHTGFVLGFAQAP